MEFPEEWASVARLLAVPDDLALMAVFRLGYLPTDQRRPTIDWSSRQRKRFAQFVFRERASRPDDVLDAPDAVPKDRN